MRFLAILLIVAVACAVERNAAKPSGAAPLHKTNKTEVTGCFVEQGYSDQYTYDWNSALDPNLNTWIFNTWWTSPTVNAIGEGLYDDHTNSGAFMFYTYYHAYDYISFFYAMWNPLGSDPTTAHNAVNWVANSVTNNMVYMPLKIDLQDCPNPQSKDFLAYREKLAKMQPEVPAPVPAKKKVTAPEATHCFYDTAYPGDVFRATWNSTLDPITSIWMYETMWSQGGVPTGVGKGLYDSDPGDGSFQFYAYQPSSTLLAFLYARWNVEGSNPSTATNVVGWLIHTDTKTFIDVPYNTQLAACTAEIIANAPNAKSRFSTHFA